MLTATTVHCQPPPPSAAAAMPAVSLLLNLKAARRGRSVLFSDEQRLLFEGGKKGFVTNTKFDFL
jgi:hypothetical protein